MTTEEKAKAYDEALKIASFYYGNKHLDAKKLLEKLFPKLAESEDERIRKAALEGIEYLERKLGWDAIGNTDILDVKEYLERQKEQKPIKMVVYEVGKGTTICGQDYKCKKDYKIGTCRYIKDVIYHCSRDGYLNDQNGVSRSCTPEWFNEYFQSNTEWAEEEKTSFVSGQFLQCKLSFDGFKEGEHYWFEYVGDDMYIGRSDNILNQKFHITPRQLFTLFTQQLDDTQEEQKPNYCHYGGDPNIERCRCCSAACSGRLADEQKPTECIPDSVKFEEGFKTGKELGFREGVESVKEQKSTATINGEPVPTENHSVDIPLPEWSEEDEHNLNSVISLVHSTSDGAWGSCIGDGIENWLKNLPERFNLQPKQEWNEDNIKELTKFEVAMLHIGMSFFGSSAGLNPNNTNEVKKQAKLLLELVPKQEWSEEEHRVLTDAASIILEDVNRASSIEEEKNLEKLASKLQSLLPQSKVEWSEEDEALFELLHQCVCRCINDDRMDYRERDKISKTMIPFIEKLQTLHPQQQTICDEKHVPSREMILAIWELGNEWKENPTGVTQREYIQKYWKESSYYDKLKSTNPQPHTVSIKDATKFGNLEYERGVKDGIQHVKNHQWKPSVEQMNGLAHAINLDVYDAKRYGLDSLYNDLNKLGVKEEESEYCQPFNPDY